MKPKRKPRLERPPCIECGSNRCRSPTTWACWQRTYVATLVKYGWERSYSYTGTLKQAGIPIIEGPSPTQNSNVYAPAWAVDHARHLFRSYRARETEDRLRALTVLFPDPRTPEFELAIDRLQAIGILRGWKRNVDGILSPR